MITVFHFKEEYNHIGFNVLRSNEMKFPGYYEKVAEVDTDNLEEAFKLTNTIDKHWSENNRVRTTKKTRSTSCNDVMELDGKYYICEFVGWKEI